MKNHMHRLHKNPANIRLQLNKQLGKNSPNGCFYAVHNQRKSRSNDLCIDDCIADDSIVQVIDAFVDTLDLIALDFKTPN